MTHTTDKALRLQYSYEELRKFKLNDEISVRIPIPSKPFFARDKKFDRYEKTSNEALFPTVKQIKKNGDAEGFVWHTTPEKLYELNRWGVRIPEIQSMIGKTINALGQYRLIAHERIMRGMISNTHLFKIKLLDHYQSRFELLQPLETLVNQPVPSIEREADFNEFKKKLIQTVENYIEELKIKRDTLKTQFESSNIQVLSPKAFSRIEDDIQEDIEGAMAIRIKIADDNSLRQFIRTPDTDSFLSLVKEQMKRNLYAMQGINQDVTMTRNREVAAFTRGEINSCIEEAKAVLYEYGIDLRNNPSVKHHGIFGPPGTKIAHDFSVQNLSSEDERQALTAIAFIDQYAQLDMTNQKKPKLISKTETGERVSSLKIIYATSWRVFLTVGIFFRSALDLIKKFFVSMWWWTQPWEDGYPNAVTELRKLAKPNDPFWYKAWKFIKIGWYNFRDIFKSIWDLCYNLLVDELPNHIKNDYSSTHPIVNEKGKAIDENIVEDVVLNNAEKEIEFIQAEERKRLSDILEADFGINLEQKEAEEKRLQACSLVFTSEHLDINFMPQFEVVTNAAYVRSGDKLFYINKKHGVYQEIEISEHERNSFDEIFKVEKRGIISEELSPKELFDIMRATKHVRPRDRYFAQLDYDLTRGDQNDLSSIPRGIGDFINLISKNLYAKHPFEGGIYTATYIFSLLTVLLPPLASQTGPVGAVMQVMAKSLGSEGVSGGIAVASTVAPAAAGCVNAVVHGPKSWLGQGLEAICSDPASTAASIAAAWGIGYLAANGLFGYDLGVLSKMAREDLGQNPDMGYVALVAKCYVLVSEALHRNENDPFKGMPLEMDEELLQNIFIKEEKDIRQFHLINWLSKHQSDIPKLPPNTLFNLERLIRKLFPEHPEHADSLCRILYPEEEYSIAYQFFAIPLRYIPVIFRVLASPLVSWLAWSNECTAWHLPMKNASVALFKLMIRDLTRLVVFVKEVIGAVYSFVATPFKMVANIIGISLARVTGLFGVDIGHATHVAASYVDTFFDTLGQMMNPGRLLKSVQVAHPNHTVRFVEATYVPVLKKLVEAELKRTNGNMVKTLSDAVSARESSKRLSGSFTDSGSSSHSLYKQSSSFSSTGSSSVTTPRSSANVGGPSSPSGHR